MEVIPLIINNYHYALIAYGYYSTVRSGVNSYNTGIWIYDKTRRLYRMVVPKVNSNQWEFVENIEILDPKQKNVFLLLDNIEEDYTFIKRIN